MNHKEFVEQFIYPKPTLNEIACPIDSDEKCSFFVQATTVLLRDNNILIVGDNRITDTLKNKLILISNIDLIKNTFDISYIEANSKERIFIYLFTANIDLETYNYGINIGVGSSTTKNTIFTTYELISDYLYPPALTIDKGKISLKVIDKNTYEDAYIHLNLDFDLITRDTINLRLETLPNIKKNKELYTDYFHGQIKKYQDFYFDYLKKKEDYKKQKEKEALLAEENRILFMRKIAIQGTLLIVLLIIIGVYLYRTSKLNKKNTPTKKTPKWKKKKDIVSNTKVV